jgi:N utilization substance protein A
MAIARDPGDRSKVAVATTDENIDAVGTCVGMKGSRVQMIVRELKGEKIDVLEWNPDPEIFIGNALQPAKVIKVTIIDEEEGKVEVIVPDDQLSLAIGRRGQNVRLAAKLTGWRIDIKSESEVSPQLKEQLTDIFKSDVEVESEVEKEEQYKIEEYEIESDDEIEPISIIELDGIGSKIAQALQNGGFSTVESIAEATIDGLTSIPGIGDTRAKKIRNSAIELLGRL